LTDHNFRREIGDIENMSTEDLARLANRQREEIEDWLWTKERLQRELSLVLELECR
jgi:fumarylacetoacetate (FAA) hydrolase family protein